MIGAVELTTSASRERDGAHVDRALGILDERTQHDSHGEDTLQMVRLLGGGVPGDVVGLPRSRLAVLPGTMHAALIDRSEWLLAMISEFLVPPMPSPTSP